MLLFQVPTVVTQSMLSMTLDKSVLTALHHLMVFSPYGAEQVQRDGLECCDTLWEG